MINNIIDATNLKTDATEKDIYKLIDFAIEKKFASVCIAPHWIDKSFTYSNSSINICTVVGFPNGYNHINTMLYETDLSIDKGATEIDFVLNRLLLELNNIKELEENTNKIIELCNKKNVISKWIIEITMLEQKQIDILINIANKLNPNFVKTSTGFFGSCTVDHIKLLRKNLNPNIKVKASAGISTIEDCNLMHLNGADRIGVSKVYDIF